MTPEQFDRVVHDDVDAEMRDRHAAHEAELAEIATYARQLTRQQAQEIIAAATELERHLGGCNLSVENCETCCGQEHDAAASWWAFDVPAAHQRLALGDAHEVTGRPGNPVDPT
jgi:hypothetical protein